MTTFEMELDPFDIRRARRASGVLREFNAVGVLTAADVHVALRLGELAGVEDEWVLLATALAVRAPRLANVTVDLATIHETATVESEEDVDLSTLPWPPVAEWIVRVGASGLVAVGDVDGDESSPFRLVGANLYLDRYWKEEGGLASDLLALSEQPPPQVDLVVLREGLTRLFPGETASRQCLAAASAVLRQFTVVAGGPGTGKTTTVARIVALLADQAAAKSEPPPLVALAAPTGKAASRLEEAVHDEALNLPVDDGLRAQLLGLQASTIHRLLGSRPDSHSRFRHDRRRRLPHDVVIIDESSMVSLPLTARLVDAVRSDARLILVGDPGQLASIEAGAVLGDIVGPAAERLIISEPARSLLGDVTGHPVTADEPETGVTIGDGIIVLDRVHRFGEGIAQLADAIRRGDADTAVDILRNPPADVMWIPVDLADSAAGTALKPIRERAVAAAGAMIDAASAGDAVTALAALDSFRLLCPHRLGAHGVAGWNATIESWLAGKGGDLGTDGQWYVGRPLLVTKNDYELRLFNGDTGVVIRTDADQVRAAFARRNEVFEVSPSRLSAVDTVYAMTIHKSQGSQFETAAVLLPAPSSRILTRELVYTAATRARKLLILAGTEETIRAALARPVARTSGLRERLWGS
jgi:exodeoxyribonuclease V alpha subunit